MKLILPCIALAACLLAGCYKHTECPAYSDTLLDNWFPYTDGAMYYFSSSAGQTDTMKIAPVYKSEGHVARWRAGRGETHCGIEANVQSYAGYDYPGWVHLFVVHQVSEPQTGETAIVYFKFKDVSAKLKATTELQTEIGGDYKVTALQNIPLNGITYNDVRLLEPVTNQVSVNTKIDKVFIARGKGVIGYRTYPAGEEYWVK